MSKWMQRLPPLPTLIAFEAAFRHQNFTRAADELFYSQATVSRRIGELEADLGVELFIRQRHDVQPTAAAESLATSIRLAFGELAATTAEVRGSANANSGLTIYSDLSLASTVIAPMLGDFQRRHPDLKIRVLSSFEPITSTREEFDVGIQYAHADTESLTVEPIADELVMAVCSPDFAAKLPADPTAADLVRFPLLHVDYGQSSWADWQTFLSELGGGDLVVPDGLTVTSYVVCLDIAEGGDGLALGWGHTVRPRLDSGSLVAIPGLAHPLTDAICAYRRRGAAPNPHADDFVATLTRRLSQPIPG